MTGWVEYLLERGVGLEAIESGMRAAFPAVGGMVGVGRYLGSLRMEWEGRGVRVRRGGR